MCSVPRMCWRISEAAASESPARQQHDQLAVLLVGEGEHLLGMGDERDQVAHLALDLGHLGDQLRRAGGLGDADVEADVGAPVLLEVGRARHPLDPRLERREVGGLGALGGEDRRADLDRDPAIEDRPGVAAQRLLVTFVQRRARGDEGPAGAPADRVQVTGLDQGGQGLTQGRSRDPQLPGELALRRQLCAGREQAGADRRAEPLDGFLERGRRPNRLEHRLGRGVALCHPPKVTPPGAGGEGPTPLRRRGPPPGRPAGRPASPTRSRARLSAPARCARPAGARACGRPG